MYLLNKNNNKNLCRYSKAFSFLRKTDLSEEKLEVVISENDKAEQFKDILSSGNKEIQKEDIGGKI